MGVIVVVIIGFGLGIGVLGVLDGTIRIPFFWIAVAVFGYGVLSIIGGIFSRDHNRDRAINGEIEAELQKFCDRRYKMTHYVMAGKASQKDIDAINAEEKAFRDMIEYGVVTDGAENYYSYKAKK